MSGAGIVATMSISGSRSRNTRTSSAPIRSWSSVPVYATSTATMLRPRRGSGAKGRSGIWRIRPTEVISSGTVRVHSAQARSTSSERSQGQMNQPA